MAAKRLTRKQLLKEPDEFLTLTQRVFEWIKANPRQMIIGAGIVIGVFALAAGYRYFNARRTLEASRLLSQGLATYQQQLTAGDQEKALEAVRPDFEKLVKEFSGKPAGRLGQIYYGQILLKAKKPEEAETLFQRAWSEYGSDPALTNIILSGLAQAYLQAGDKKAATAQFEKIVAGSDTLNKDEALFQLGLLYLESDQAEKSKEMFTQLSENFPNSIYAEMAREKTAG